MYPSADFKLLELRKLQCRLKILKHRQECIIAGRQIQATVETLETWRQRIAQWGGMIKFAPGLFGIFRGLRGMMGRKSRAAADSHERGEPSRKPGKVSSIISWVTTGLKAYNTFRGAR